MASLIRGDSAWKPGGQQGHVGRRRPAATPGPHLGCGLCPQEPASDLLPGPGIYPGEPAHRPRPTSRPSPGSRPPRERDSRADGPAEGCGAMEGGEPPGALQVWGLWGSLGASKDGAAP